MSINYVSIRDSGFLLSQICKVQARIGLWVRAGIFALLFLCTNTFGQAVSDFSTFSHAAVKAVTARACRENGETWKNPAQRIGSMLSKVLDQTRPNSEERRRQIKEISGILESEKNRIFQILKEERRRISQNPGSVGNSLQYSYDQHYLQVRESGDPIVTDLIVKHLDQDSQSYERLMELECTNRANALESRLVAQYQAEISIKESNRGMWPLPSVSPPQAQPQVIIIPPSNPNACIQDGGPIYCPNYRGRR